MGVDVQLARFTCANRQAAPTNLELEDPSEVGATDDTDRSAGQEAQLHQSPPEGPFTTEADQPSFGAVGEGIEARHGVLLRRGLNWPEKIAPPSAPRQVDCRKKGSRDPDPCPDPSREEESSRRTGPEKEDPGE